jgi:hypothetical protein
MWSWLFLGEALPLGWSNNIKRNLLYFSILSQTHVPPGKTLCFEQYHNLSSHNSAVL